MLRPLQQREERTQEMPWQSFGNLAAAASRLNSSRQRNEENPLYQSLPKPSSLEHSSSPSTAPPKALTPRDMTLSRPVTSSYRIHTPDSGRSTPVRSSSPYASTRFATESYSAPVKTDYSAPAKTESPLDLSVGKLLSSSSTSKFTDLLGAQGSPDLQCRLNAQEKHISRLSEVFEERILHANSCVQRLASEHRQRLDDLQSRLDERGEMIELKNHMQWAEGRIHQLSARITCNEEFTQNFKQNAPSPEKPAVTRGDLDVMRNELSSLKASGVVTSKALSDAIDPLRRELRQLAERLVQGLNADVSSIVDKLMREVQQVQENCTRSEKMFQLENSAMKQEAEKLSSSLKKELKKAGEGSDFIKRKEFNDTTNSLNQEMTALTSLVSRMNDTISKLEVRDTTESIRRDVNSLMVEFSKISKLDLTRGSTPQPNGLENETLMARKTEELASNLRREMRQAVEEMRASVLNLEADVPKKREIAGIVETAMQKRLDERQPQSMAAAVNERGSRELQSFGQDLAMKIEHMNRDISNLFGRTSLVRALAVNSAAIAADRPKGGEKIGDASSARPSKLLVPPFRLEDPGSGRSSLNRSSLLEKREAASARVSLLMVGKTAVEHVTKDEFLHAVQELRWDLCQIDHMAESGHGAAEKYLEMEPILATVQDDLKRIQKDLRQKPVESGSGDTAKVLQMETNLSMMQAELQRMRNEHRESSVESVSQRLSSQEDGLRKLRSIVEQQGSNIVVAASTLAQPPPSGSSASYVASESFERDLSDLMGRSSLARALAVNAAAGLVSTQYRVADLETQVQGLKITGSVQGASPTSIVSMANASSDSANRDAAWMLSRGTLFRSVAIHSARDGSSVPSKGVMNTGTYISPTPALLPSGGAMNMGTNVSPTPALPPSGGAMNMGTYASPTPALPPSRGVVAPNLDKTMKAGSNDSDSDSEGGVSNPATAVPPCTDSEAANRETARKLGRTCIARAIMLHSRR